VTEYQLFLMFATFMAVLFGTGLLVNILQD